MSQTLCESSRHTSHRHGLIVSDMLEADTAQMMVEDTLVTDTAQMMVADMLVADPLLYLVVSLKLFDSKILTALLILDFKKN